MPVDEVERRVCEDVGQIPPVGLERRAVDVERPLPVIAPAAPESRELVEPAAVRMITRVQCSQMPLANQPGRIPRRLQKVRQRPLAQRQPVQPTSFQRVYRPRPVRIPPGQKRRPRRSAHGGAGVVLSEPEALAGQMVKRRSPRQRVAEAADVAIAHIVRKNQDDVRAAVGPRRHQPALSFRSIAAAASISACESFRKP